MRQWFYTRNGQQQGPIQETELVEMFASGKLHADVLVWTEGLENWTPARDIESLVPAAMSPPSIPVASSNAYIPTTQRTQNQSSARDGNSISGFGWYLEVLRKYAVFSGRARRKEY